MKAKYIYKCLMIAFAALLLGSCSSPEVDSKFDENATDRLSGRQKELNDLLLSSADGWKAVYYTDSTQLGGWTHLFKFLPGGKVDMASDFTGKDGEIDTKTYQSQYNIQLGSTVSLVFSTQNRIHLLSDANNYPTAALLAKGYLGDFQFYYYGEKDGNIIFRTNRNGHFLRFVKATPKDWTDLPGNVPMIKNITGDMNSPLFRLLEINDGTATKNYDFSYNASARFGTGYSIDPAVNTSYDLALSFNPGGVYSKLPLDVKGQKLTDFLYDAPTNSFVATGKDGVKATIKYTNAPPRLTDNYKVTLPAAGAPSTAYGYIAANLSAAPTNSQLCMYLLNEINNASVAKVNRVQFTFYNNRTVDIMYSFTGGKATVYHRATVTEDAVNKTIILKHSLWHNGTSVIAADALVKNLDDKLMDPKGLYVTRESFRITYSNTIYTFTCASSSFRITTYAFQ
ncbi:hypothetical protein HNP37_003945 [Flavobacterium nitrogenifigens]|uniref:DUF4302 domain-containing protein n=2 Tax=Flavobacterium TaxID=237 RepID=A0A7W7J1M7_9FLAO|nr:MULTISPECIES: DUF4302 domain-containing protein [Flavobacterium]MBB4803865.1 hypothetical protein [Flavobacterium nitrogenifigens]MBB6388983.1 hypothetical protein [Flavobacterium notoginsengisoli]